MNSAIEKKEHTFLIVDDERDILDSLRRFFRKRYNVLTAQSVDEAFELLEQQEVHVCMTDQRMPKMTGVEFLSVLRERYPDCVRILFTGYSDMRSVIAAINSGQVYGYISKPWEGAELQAMVARAVEHYELSAERRRLLAQLQEANANLEVRNKELAKANKELQELDRLKNVFMELVSHELNTPVAIILGYAFLAQVEAKKLGDDHPISKALSGINNSAGRLKNITTKILKVITTDKPEVSVEFTPTEIRRLVAEVESAVSPFLDKRDQELDVQIEPTVVASIDAPKIRDALMHLVMNAIKFSPDGNTISVRAAESETHQGAIDIQVIDQGIGINEEDEPKIWESFFSSFQSKNHSSGEYQFEKRGIGLGLALVKHFVGLHRGEVGLRTKTGEGSTFTLTIPKAQPDQESETSPAQ